MVSGGLNWWTFYDEYETGFLNEYMENYLYEMSMRNFN